MPRLFRKKRNNNGNGNQSENQTPDSNEGFFESQAAKFVSKMGMKLDKKIVKFPEESGEETRKGIRVNSIQFGTYFHGFGLRSNDIIYSVNGLPIISTDLVNRQLHHIINISKTSQLIMKLERSETVESTAKKHVELNNKGDELRHKSGELEYLPDAGTCKIKSVYYGGKYLTVDDRSGTNRLISDTNATNNSVEFTIRQYQPSVWLQSLNPEFVTLQHIASREYILTDDGGLSLLNTQIHPAPPPPPPPPPSPPPPSPPISGTNVYLFKVIEADTSQCNCPSNTVTLRPIRKTGSAIGFVDNTSIASLMSPEGCETHFELI